MGNSYNKRDYLFNYTSGLVLAAQVEGLESNASPRYHNTKIYRDGATGMRDYREFFAGIPRGTGVPGWITGITRLDTTYILAFAGTSLYGWKRPVPGSGLSPSEVAYPRGAVALSFNDFMPAAGVVSFVTVLPDERANPAVFFSKPGVTRMWKVYGVNPRASGVESRVITGTGTRTQGQTDAEASAFAAGSSLTDAGVIAAPTVVPLTVSYWGLNAPTGRPTVTVSADTAGKLNSAVSGGLQYDWVWVHVNSTTGSESNPSAGLTATISVATGNQVKVECPVDTGGDPQIDRIRLYRKGGVLTDYHRLAEVSLRRDRGVLTGAFNPQTVTYVDTKADNDIRDNPILRLDNFVPFISTNQAGDAVWNAVCPLVFGPFNPGNVIFGIGEANKPGTVFWTNTGRPDSSNGTNNVDVTSSGDPLVTGVVYNGIPYVASRGEWFALDAQQGNGLTDLLFIPRKTNVGRGPLAPWAVAVGEYIFFINNEGVFATDGQNAALELSIGISPIFHGETCGEYKPIKWDAPQEMFRLFWTGPEVHFIYPDSDEVLQHLIYDGKRWKSEDFARGRYAYGDVETTPSQPSTVQPWEADPPYLKTTCAFNDVAWPERNLILGTNQGAAFLCRPYTTLGWEMSDYYFNSGNPESGSYYGWVVGQFRTGTDNFDKPALLKELGDVSFEAAGRWTSPGYAGRVKTTLYATEEGGAEAVGETGRLSGAQPIGSTIYNVDETKRGRYIFPLEDENVYSSAWDFEFYGKWEFHNLTLFYSELTEVIRHWQLDNTNHSINGWQHVRDGYLDLTLYGDAVLTLMVDDSSLKTQNVLFSPIITRGDGSVEDKTGIRYKYYFSLLPMKGKKFTWSLDCNEGMQIWNEGIEVNGKRWISSTGYQNVNPFADGVK